MPHSDGLKFPCFRGRFDARGGRCLRLNTRRTVAQRSQGMCPDQIRISRSEQGEKGVPNSCIKNYYVDLAQTSPSPVRNIQEVCGVGLGGFRDGRCL